MILLRGFLTYFNLCFFFIFVNVSKCTIAVVIGHFECSTQCILRPFPLLLVIGRGSVCWPFSAVVVQINFFYNYTNYTVFRNWVVLGVLLKCNLMSSPLSSHLGVILFVGPLLFYLLFFIIMGSCRLLTVEYWSF